MELGRFEESRHMELGRRIAHQRAVAGLKSKELADLAGIKQSYVSSIENGRKIPTIQVLQKIAKALGVSVSELLGEDRPQLTPKQRKLLNAVEGLTDMQLEAVINLVNELKKGNRPTKEGSKDFLVAEKDDNGSTSS